MFKPLLVFQPAVLIAVVHALFSHLDVTFKPQCSIYGGSPPAGCHILKPPWKNTEILPLCHNCPPACPRHYLYQRSTTAAIGTVTVGHFKPQLPWSLLIIQCGIHKRIHTCTPLTHTLTTTPSPRHPPLQPFLCISQSGAVGPDAHISHIEPPANKPLTHSTRIGAEPAPAPSSKSLCT